MSFWSKLKKALVGEKKPSKPKPKPKKKQTGTQAHRGGGSQSSGGSKSTGTSNHRGGSNASSNQRSSGSTPSRSSGSGSTQRPSQARTGAVGAASRGSVNNAPRTGAVRPASTSKPKSGTQRFNGSGSRSGAIGTTKGTGSTTPNLSQNSAQSAYNKYRSENKNALGLKSSTQTLNWGNKTETKVHVNKREGTASALSKGAIKPKITSEKKDTMAERNYDSQAEQRRIGRETQEKKKQSSEEYKKRSDDAVRRQIAHMIKNGDFGEGFTKENYEKVFNSVYDSITNNPNYRRNLNKGAEEYSKKVSSAFAQTESKKAQEKIDEKHGGAGTLKSEDLTNEDYLRLANASRIGGKIGTKSLGKDLAEKVGSRTAYSAGKNTISKVATGAMQGIAYGDALEGSVGTYNKQAKGVLKDVKESEEYMAGYMGGQMAGFMAGGVGQAGRGIVRGLGEQSAKKMATEIVTKKLGKESAQRIMKNIDSLPNKNTLIENIIKNNGRDIAEVASKTTFGKGAKNTVGDMVASLPMDVMDAAKMSRDENGKIDKNAFAATLALNVGLGGVAGGAMEAGSATIARASGKKMLRLQAKENAGTITEAERDELNSLYRDALNAKNDFTATKSGVADEYLGRADLSLQNAISEADAREYFRLKGIQSERKLIESEKVKMERLNKRMNAARAKYEMSIKSAVDDIRANVKKTSAVDIRDLRKIETYYTATGMKSEAKEARKLLDTAYKNFDDSIDTMAKATADISAKLGRDVVVERADDFVKTLAEKGKILDDPTTFGGYIERDADGNIVSIHVNADSEHAMEFSLGHELTHAFESLGKEYDQFAEAIQKYAGDDWQTELDNVRTQYAGVYDDLTDETVRHEALGNLVGRYLFSEDSTFLDNLVKDDPSLFQRLYEFVKRLVSGDGIKDKQLTDLNNRFENMFNQLTTEQKSIAESEPDSIDFLHGTAKSFDNDMIARENVGENDPKRLAAIQRKQKHYREAIADLDDAKAKYGDDYEKLAEARREIYKKHKWFQGYDGEWRYYIEDKASKFNFGKYILTEGQSKEPQLVYFDRKTGSFVRNDKAYEDLLKEEQAVERLLTVKSLNADDRAWLKKLTGKDRMSKTVREQLEGRKTKIAGKTVLYRAFEKEGIPLQMIYDHPEFYAMYPEAKEIRFRFKDAKDVPETGNSAMDFGGLGYTRDGVPFIELNPYGFNKNTNFYKRMPEVGYDPEKQARKTMVHELQHWIQDRDGLSPGGTDSAYRELLDEGQSLPKNFDRDLENFNKWNDAKDKALGSMFDLSSDETEKFLKKYNKSIFRQLPSIKKRVRKALKDSGNYASKKELQTATREATIQEAMKRLSAGENPIRISDKKFEQAVRKYIDRDYSLTYYDERSPRKLYEQTSGEQEARDVEAALYVDEGKKYDLPIDETANVRYSDPTLGAEPIDSAELADRYYPNRLTKNAEGLPRVANNDVGKGNKIDFMQGSRRGDISPKTVVDSNGTVTKQANDDYMRAAEAGDRETAQRYVDAVLEAKGYTIDAYHGSDAFGFTEFDLDAMDDNISIFASRSPETAGTYTYGKQKDILGNSDQRAKEERDAMTEDLRKIFADLGMEEDPAFDYAFNMALHEGSMNDFVWDWLTDEPISATKLELADDLSYELDQFGPDSGGIYHAKLKMDNPLVAEGNGRAWNDISTSYKLSDEEKKLLENAREYQKKVKEWTDIHYGYTDDEVEEYLRKPYFESEEELERGLKLLREEGVEKTREISKYAKEHGYDGVIFKQISDLGPVWNEGVTPIDDIYVVFKSEQFKSADPVTYRDDGSIIPLIERGTETEPDIRFSVGENKGRKKLDKAESDYYESLAGDMAEEEAEMARGMEALEGISRSEVKGQVSDETRQKIKSQTLGGSKLSDEQVDKLADAQVALSKIKGMQVPEELRGRKDSIKSIKSKYGMDDSNNVLTLKKGAASKNGEEWATVESTYKQMSKDYPELFPDSITDVSKQFDRLMEVSALKGGAKRYKYGSYGIPRERRFEQNDFTAKKKQTKAPAQKAEPKKTETEKPAKAETKAEPAKPKETKQKPPKAENKPKAEEKPKEMKPPKSEKKPKKPETPAEEKKSEAPTIEETLENAKKGYISTREMGLHAKKLGESWSSEVEMLDKSFKKAAKKGEIGGKKVREESYDSAFNKAVKKVDEDFDKVWNRVMNREDGIVETVESAAEKHALMRKLVERAGAGDETAAMLHLKLIDKLDSGGSLAGHMLQLQSYILKDSPEGRLRYMLRQIKRINKEYAKVLKGKEIELTPEQVREILNAKDAGEAARVAEKIGKEIWKEVPAGPLESLNQIRHWAMLFNPKTHGRNLGGNLVFMGAREMSDALEIGATRLASKTGKGKRFLGDDAIMAKTVSRKEVSDCNDVLNKRFADDYAIHEQHADRWAEGKRTAGYLNEKTNSKVLNAGAKTMNKLIDVNYNLLDREDRFFFRPAYKKEYIRYCKAKGFTEDVNGQKIVTAKSLEAMTDAQRKEATDWAMEKAKIATFRDDSAISKRLIEWKGKAEEGGAVGKALNVGMESVLPFVKTPVNILRRGADYSPIGLGRGMIKYVTAKDADGFMNAIHQLSTGLTGTGVFALGWWAAQHDWVTVNAGDISGDAFYDRDMGYQDYSLKVHVLGNDYSASMDWMAPMQFAFFQGAAVQNEKGGEWSTEEFLKILQASVDPMMEMSFMSSAKDTMESFFQRAYRDGSGAEASFAEAAGRTLFGSLPQGWLGSFIPQLVSQSAGFSDNMMRDTSSTEEDEILKSWDTWRKQLQNKIPGYREQLHSKLNRKGEKVTNEGANVVTKFANAFANPANVKKITYDKYDQEIIDIYSNMEDGKDKTFFLMNFTGNPSYDIKGDNLGKGESNRRMTYDEKYKYMKKKRSEQWKDVQTMVDSRSYNDMTNEMKVEEVKDAHYISTVKADRSVYGNNYAKNKLVDGNDTQSEIWKKVKTYGGNAKDYVDSYLAVESLQARSHLDIGNYHMKAIAIESMTNKTDKQKDALEKAYGVWGDKVKPAKKFLEQVGDVKKALTEFSDAYCSGTGYCKSNEVSTSKRNLSIGLANVSYKVRERTYRAGGYDWQSAQAGGGLKKYGYSYEALEKMESEALVKFDKDHNNSLKKAEVQEYIDSLGIDNIDEKACLFQYLNSNASKNPYAIILDHLEWGSEPDAEVGSGRGGWGRRYGRRGRGGWGHGGGGGGGSGGTMPTTATGAIKGSVTDPFGKVNKFGAKSNLDDVYRKKAKKLLEANRKKLS